MTETAVRPVIFAFSLNHDLENGRFIQHKLFLKPRRDYGIEPSNVGHRKDLGVIAFSECRDPWLMDSKELWFQGRPSLSSYRSNVERVWKALYSFFREQERLAMRRPLWFENPGDYCPASISGIGYFCRFKAREGSELVACLPDIDELHSDMLDLKSYAKMFGNHRTSSA